MIRLTLITAAILSAQMVMAWGKTGHMIVGQLADQYLTPKTRAEIKKILGDETISQASVWLDIVSKEKKYRYQHNWHYYYKDAVLPENSVMKIEEFTNMLADQSIDPKAKVESLRALLHIAGDLHTPLHCGYEKDNGGHGLKLTWEESGEKTELHKAWDTDMILMKDPDVNSHVQKLQSFITADQMQQWGNKDFKLWATESQELLNQVYDFKGKVLSKAYYEQNVIIIEDRLSMSAVRLAFLLNSIFDPKA